MPMDQVTWSWTLWIFASLLLLLEVTADDGGDKANISLPVTTQIAGMQVDVTSDTSCPTDHQRRTVMNHISNGIKSQLRGIAENVVECTPSLLGKIELCPAQNCSEIFNQVEIGLFRFSGFYWLQLPTEIATKVYCNHVTRYPEVSSCSLLFLFHSSAESGIYALRLQDGVRVEVFCNRVTGQPEPESCAQAHQLELPSGHYTLRPPDHTPICSVYCDMDREECGSSGWAQLVSLDLSDLNTTCPGDWQLITYPIRACSRVTGDGCDSVVFTAQGHNYTRVCGRVTAHQRGPAYGFWLSQDHGSINFEYLNGVSITHGSTPRQHVWSFAASLGDTRCPCSENDREVAHPDFVGNHYFCETDSEGTPPVGEFNLDNPLWDGAGCNSIDDACCSFNHPPWFSVDLNNATTDNIEVRLCGLYSPSNYSTPITQLELYVQ